MRVCQRGGGSEEAARIQPGDSEEQASRRQRGSEDVARRQKAGRTGAGGRQRGCRTGFYSWQLYFSVLLIWGLCRASTGAWSLVRALGLLHWRSIGAWSLDGARSEHR